MKPLIIFIAVLFSTAVWAGDWNSSPRNWENSPQNWDNSSQNWRNSPKNWDNSTKKWGNNRIIRNENGDPIGYVVPKTNGGMNIFDLQGHRKAYVPAPAVPSLRDYENYGLKRWGDDCDR